MSPNGTPFWQFMHLRIKGSCNPFKNCARIFEVSDVLLTTVCPPLGAMAIEEAKYTVIKKIGAFELRQCEAKIVAETFMEGDFSLLCGSFHKVGFSLWSLSLF